MGQRKPKSRPPLQHPYDVVRRAVAAGISRVIVGVSCGKDATATLALACEHFDDVQAYFMYMVPGLGFQEQYLGYLERRFDVRITRLPHWMLSGLYRGNSFRHPTANSHSIRKLSIRDIENYVRQKTGIEWFCTGEKAIDSVERNAQIRNCNGLNESRRRIYPLAYWSHGQVFSYLRGQGIALPPDYRAGYPHSFGSLWYRELAPIREHFPDDWRKVREHFPLVEAQMVRYEQRAKRERNKDAAKQPAESPATG